SPSGKMIPMEIATRQNHTCVGRQQDEMDFSIFLMFFTTRHFCRLRSSMTKEQHDGGSHWYYHLGVCTEMRCNLVGSGLHYFDG
ncbi:MAG TPA: hypothetical protein VEL11_17340, partial [Candidatus Bathyarchaeia archaeon]|nr:hypothetical protein [Candidatus Bathyarchaeia archaeon]